MEIAQLILAYLETLIWPGLVIFVLVRYRAEFQTLLRRITSESSEVEGFGLKARLRLQTREEKAAQLKAEIEEVSSELPDVKGLPGLAITESLRDKRVRVLNQYVLSEELAFRVLEDQLASSIQRQVVIDTPEGPLRFDGMTKKDGAVLVVEVKLLTGAMLPSSVLEHELAKAEALLQHLGGPVRLQLVLVSTQTKAKARKILEDAREVVSSRAVPVDVYAFTFDDLVANVLGVSR